MRNAPRVERLNEANRVILDCVAWDSRRREPTQRGVCDYAFDDPGKNTSEFIWPKSSRTKRDQKLG